MEDNVVGVSLHTTLLEAAKARLYFRKHRVEIKHVDPYDFMYYGRIGRDFTPERYKFFYGIWAYPDFRALKADFYNALLGKIAEEKGDWVAP